jgi:hypothetical protein
MRDILTAMKKEELIDLLLCYDWYISTNQDEMQGASWITVGLSEFYKNDYNEIEKKFRVDFSLEGEFYIHAATENDCLFKANQLLQEYYDVIYKAFDYGVSTSVQSIELENEK